MGAWECMSASGVHSFISFPLLSVFNSAGSFVQPEFFKMYIITFFNTRRDIELGGLYRIFSIKRQTSNKRRVHINAGSTRLSLK